MMAITATAMRLALPRDCIVRRAEAMDGEALARLIAEPAVALGGRPRDASGLALVELTDRSIDTLVAEAREGLQGFLQLRWGRRAPSHGWMRGSVELRRHYVRTRHRGAGVAGRLLESAIGVARSRDATCIWLKVGKESPQAIRFYQKHGFRIAGTALFLDGQRHREHWVMHRVLEKGPAPLRKEG